MKTNENPAMTGDEIKNGEKNIPFSGRGLHPLDGIPQ